MYLKPSTPIFSVPARGRNKPMAYSGNQSAPAGGRILAAKYNAIQARRNLMSLGWLGVAPLGAIRFRGRTGDRGALISGMGCTSCRTGLSWLGQNETASPIATDLTPPDIPFIPPSSDVSFNPPPSPGLPLPMIPPSNVEITPPALVTSLTPPPSAPLLTNNPLPLNTAAAKTPQPSFLQKQTIAGIPNGWLIGAAAVIIGLGVMAGRR